MKIINDLVVCEVPKEAYDFRANGAAGFAYSLPNSGYWHIVDTPFPCTIIGLASEIDGKDAIQMLQMHGIILPADYEPIPALHGQIKRIYGMEITDTTDLLFLKKVQQ